MYRRLVYASQTTRIVTPLDIAKLVDMSRVNNALENITGLLVYDRGFFFQVLEGPQDNVEYVFERITHDDRHMDLTVLEDVMVKDRAFSNWRMGYSKPRVLPLELRETVCSLSRLRAFNSPERGRDPQVRKVVRSFLKMMQQYEPMPVSKPPSRGVREAVGADLAHIGF